MRRTHDRSFSAVLVKPPIGDPPMLEMFGDIAIGLVLFIVGVLLIIIGIPRHGQHPRFLRFEASLVVYPAVIMVFLAFGVAMMLRGYALI
jgi:hypothetical protein